MKLVIFNSSKRNLIIVFQFRLSILHPSPQKLVNNELSSGVPYFVYTFLYSSLYLFLRLSVRITVGGGNEYCCNSVFRHPPSLVITVSSCCFSTNDLNGWFLLKCIQHPHHQSLLHPPSPPHHYHIPLHHHHAPITPSSPLPPPPYLPTLHPSIPPSLTAFQYLDNHFYIRALQGVRRRGVWRAPGVCQRSHRHTHNPHTIYTRVGCCVLCVCCVIQTHTL